MTNSTDVVESTDSLVVWFIIPVALGFLLYSAFLIFMYPYARPIVPFWLLLVGFLFPPFFPFLSVYVLLTLCAFSPRRHNTSVIVVDASARGRVIASGPSVSVTNATPVAVAIPLQHSERRIGGNNRV